LTKPNNLLEVVIVVFLRSPTSKVWKCNGKVLNNKEQIVPVPFCEEVTFFWWGGARLRFIPVRNDQGLLFSDSLLRGNDCCMEHFLYYKLAVAQLLKTVLSF
jgi:hypothetical protein